MNRVVTILLLLNILLFSSCQTNLSNSDNTQPVLSEKDSCAKGGGAWATFRNTCADSCQYARTKGWICGQALTNGCDCGPANCWNGQKCEKN